MLQNPRDTVPLKIVESSDKITHNMNSKKVVVSTDNKTYAHILNRLLILQYTKYSIKVTLQTKCTKRLLNLQYRRKNIYLEDSLIQQEGHDEDDLRQYY